MNENDFMLRRQEAVERMKEMSSRAAKTPQSSSMPPVPSFVRLQGNRRQESPTPPHTPKTEERKQKESPAQNGGFNIPFLDAFSKDKDLSLIIGLMLILMSEKSDKKLLFALAYILM